MSCWRVLELSEPQGDQIPQLLVKPSFRPDSYTVHLTDLTNIWSEELDLAGVVDRAAQEQSPIEISKQDTGQIAILLDNVKKPLDDAQNATCRITRHDSDAIILHASITLPEPLDRLTWKFHLEKRTSITLKNELILPLLVSSHIQHERITELISTLVAKDKAITRLVDQFESNNLDLATAFPIVSGLKAGRKLVKREQAARHVPALQPFREEAWKQRTGQLEDPDVTTLGLFQDALAQNTPEVPWHLKSEEHGSVWWASVPTQLGLSEPPPNSKAKKFALTPKPNKVAVESNDDETEDEFESRENFKDDADLDAPPKSQSHSQGRTLHEPLRRKSPTPEHPAPPKSTMSPATKAHIRNFRIGGRSKKATESSPPFSQVPGAKPDPEVLPLGELVPASSQPDTNAKATSQKTRRAFTIGGRGKEAGRDASQREVTTSPSTNRMRDAQSPTAEPASSPPPRRFVKGMTPADELYEERPEEKAGQKRAELKRKNEEAAKKLVHAKKKKRF
ncbi:XLF-domain-containing protein [Decorospora gaudefroyi]|uniref:Non-homologous end-joining factor 1 n=1 Tax=Decorospora gaudefroyi TaxID=184978 RepID=A0A6A5KPZ5_9PLEO|nr:XLF-domain-containing protein [Decorospora gaudefroyi]